MSTFNSRGKPGLTYTIPGGQQVQFTPYQIGGRNGGTAVVTGNGGLESFNYEAGSQGWRIDGNGTVDFEDGNFRGTLTGATGAFAGTVLADNITAGTITGSALVIGTAPNDFTVDSAGNLLIGPDFGVTNTGVLTANSGSFSGTVSAASFEGVNTFPDDATDSLQSGDYDAGVAGWKIDGAGNAEFNDVTARGTISTAASGTRVEVGGLGNDEITFYSATETYPGALEVGASSVSLYVPSDINDSGHGQRVAVFAEGGSAVYMSTGVFTINNEVTNFSGTLIGQVRIWDDGAEFASYYGGSYAGRFRVGRGSGTTWGSFSEHSSNIYTDYLGVWHDGLTSAYMLMSNGTNTYIGADSIVYIRPDGNAGIEYKFDTGGAKFETTYAVNVNAAGGASPAMYTNWENFSGSWGTVQVTRDPVGVCTITGLVRRVTSASGAPSAIFLTPSWARVSHQHMFPCLLSTGAIARVDLYTNGQVVTNTSVASGAWINLNMTYRSSSSV